MVCFTGSHGTGQRVARAAAAEAHPRAARARRQGRGLRVRRRRHRRCRDRRRRRCVLQRGPVVQRDRTGLRPRDIWDQFVDAFVEVVQGYKVGAPDRRHHGARPTRPRGAARDCSRPRSQTPSGAARGASSTGGHRIDRPGNWFAPTVLVDVDDTMALMRDESFGPVIGVAKVAERRRGDRADGRHRLRARRIGVHRATSARAERILARLDVGNAYWNTADRSTVRLPWAGRRHSGLGVSMSESGVRSFVQREGLAPLPSVADRRYRSAAEVAPGRTVLAHRVVDAPRTSASKRIVARRSTSYARPARASRDGSGHRVRANAIHARCIASAMRLAARARCR